MEQGNTNIQEQELNRTHAVLQYLKANQTTVNAFLPLKLKQSELKLHLQKYDEVASKAFKTTTGFTKDKAEFKKQTGLFYEAICATTLSFLLETKNLDLAANFKVTKRKITGLPDGEVLPLISFLNGLIQTHLLPLPHFALYQITSDTLAEGLELAQKFNHSIARAATEKAQISAERKAKAAIVKELKNDIADMALLFSRYRTTDPSFYNGFKSAKKINHIGIRHNVIKGQISTGGQPLSHTLITCTGQKKTATSTLTGEYALARIRAGNREITCTHPNYPPQTKVIKIVKGRTLEVNWEL